MKQLFESNRWMAFAAAFVVIIISAAAIVFASRPSLTPPLPPIKSAQIAPGFVGKHQFGLWMLVCETPPPAAAETPVPKHLCRANARMTVRTPNSNTPMLAAGFNIIMADTQASPGLLFRLPPAARAAGTINFFIDANTTFQAPLRCSQQECFAQGAVPPAAIEQMRNGRTLSLVYTVKDRQQKDIKVRVDQLLHGFRQAYDGMVKAMGR
ncbi:MAG: invasion associated locus B family protein [Alphaproteobacteria bacterium]|nr:invasion associated locus B family protein [Alphaproteobacteria bacterium]